MSTSRILRWATYFYALILISFQQFAQAAEISGRVTAEDGITPLQGITVQARFEENAWYGAVTDSNGEYSFSGLPADTYKIRFEDNALNTYRNEWHDDAADYVSATSFVLGETDVQSGVNAALAVGGRLIGAITADTGGAPLSNIRVAAFRYVAGPNSSYWQQVKDVFSISGGSYDMGGLDDGTYRLRFSDDAGNYAPEHHDNQIEFDNATGIILASAGTVSNNASLATASRIQGTVTDEGGSSGLSGVFVYAYRFNGTSTWNYINQTTTKANGSYDLGGLTPGDYRIYFYESSGLKQSEYYDDTTDFGSASIIPLGSAATLTNYDASLAEAGRIEGTITDGSGTGIPNMNVNVYRWNASGFYWEYISTGYTDGNGTYTVGGLSTGTYRVGTYDNSGIYPERYYANASDIDSADDVQVTVGSTTSGINIALEELVVGSISGTVSNASTAGLEGIEVTLFRYIEVDGYWQETEYATTNASGQYSFDNIEVGTYRLRFIDPTENYASEYYTDAYTVESGDSVLVTAGSDTIADALLSEAASLSGTVTNSGSMPLQGIWVNLSRLNSNSEREYLLSRITEGNGTPQGVGTYSFGGLPAGTYFVEFADYNPTTTYAREFYNGKPTSNAADPVNVSEGQDVSGIDASLDLVGQISGVVTADAGGNTIESVSVTAFRFNEGNGNWDYASNVPTNNFGSFLLEGLTPGIYRVQFNDFTGNYLQEYYNDKATLLLGDSIFVTSGNTTNIFASLATASRIEGTVTEEGSGSALPNVSVVAYRETSPNSFSFVFSATTDQFGNYSLGGLTAGSYKVSFSDNNGFYLSEVYDNSTGWLNTGTDVVVAASSTTPDIDAELTAGGKISGTVTDAVTSSALDSISIYFYRQNGMSWDFQNSTGTDSAGNYESPALPVGQYRVEFYDGSELPSYRFEYYNNTYNFADASPVTVNALQTTALINAALSPIDQSSTISGTITDDDTSAPLSGIYAQAFLYDVGANRYEFLAEAVSDSNGEYIIENLPSGTFRVRFSDRTNGAYAQQFSFGASTLDNASEITLGSQASVDFIDASMQQAQTISGTVRNELGDGISGVLVSVRRWEAVNNDWFHVNAAYTLADGTYTVNGLPEGTYRIEFTPVGGSGYFGEFYDDVQTINDAIDLYLYPSFGLFLTNVDAELSGTPPEIVEPVMSEFRQTGPGTFEADFQGQPGTMYQLEKSPSMLPGSWMPDGSPFEAQSGGNPLNMSSTEPKMFWRVREE